MPSEASPSNSVLTRGGATALLDDLTAAGQLTGVSVDQMVGAFAKASPRWQEGGGDLQDLIAVVVQASDEFGPAGLRGAMSEILREVDKGVIPSFIALDAQLGDTTGAVERTYEAGRTWRDTLSELKDGALAAIGPFGDVAGGLGLMLAGGLQLIPVLKGMTISTNVFKIALASTGIGLIVVAIGAAVAAYITWKDEINLFLMGTWNKFVDAMETAMDWIAPLSRMMGVTVPEDIGRLKFSLDEAVVSTEAETVAVREATVAVEASTVAVVAAAPAVVALEVETRAFLDTVKEIPTYVGTAVNSIGAVGAVGGDFLRGAAPLGSQYGAAFTAGFFPSVESNMTTTLPTIIGGISELPTFAESGFASGGNWQQGFGASVADFAAGGGVGAIMKPFEQKLGDWSQGLQASLGPLMGAAFGALFGFVVTMAIRSITGSGVGQPSASGSFGRGHVPTEISGESGPGGTRRAAGGPVGAGRPYMVGERGPELFIPGSSGTVLPNNIAAMIGAEVAKALQRNPPISVVPPDEVTDAVLYRMDERSAIREFRANTV